MAVFNPEIQDTGAPNFTGASRGTGPNRSFEALFSGVGDVVTQATQTADTYVQNRIEDDARFGFDEQNKELGVSGESTPPELTRSQEGLSTLALAMEQGKVTPEYYYQRLTSTVKGLRAKYPGYEKKVDEIIQKVTGTRPANAFRDQLFQNLASAQEQARSSQNRDQTFIRQNLDLLWGNEADLSPEQQIELITRRKGVAGKWDYDATLAKNSDSLQQRNAEQIANGITADSISSIGDTAGLGSNDFLQVLQNASGKPLSPEQLAQVNSSLVTAKAAVGNRVRAEILRRYPNISGTRLEEMIKASTNQFDMIQTELNSGRYDMAARIASSNKIAVDQRTSELMTQFPELKTIMSINNTAGSGAAQDLFQRYIQQGYGGNSGFSEKLLSYGMAQSTTQGTYSVHDLSKAIAQNQQMKGSEKSNLLKNFLDGYSVTAEGINEENVGNFVKKNYTESSGESVLWSENGIVPNDQKLIVFNKLFDPRISKKIQEAGDPEAAQQYLSTAMDRFQNIPEFRKAASGLQEWLPQIKRYYDISYDQKSNQIVYTTKEGVSDGILTGAMGVKTRSQFQKMVGKINQGMSIMGPVLDSAGVSREEGMKRVFQDMHLDLDQSEAGQGFWEWLGEGLMAPSPSKGVANAAIPPTEGEDDDEITWSFPDQGSEDVSGDPQTFQPTESNGQGFQRVVQAGRGYTVVQLADGRQVRRDGARNWRNNNPGNIEYGKFARSQGAVGTDGRFAVFPSYEAGRKAKAALIFESPSYKNLSISQAINRYAPPFENNTAGYANGVARAAGVSLDTKMSDLSASQRERVLNAMERIEGFRQGRERVQG